MFIFFKFKIFLVHLQLNKEAVSPNLFYLFISAPKAINKGIALIASELAAQCSGVFPSKSSKST